MKNIDGLSSQLESPLKVLNKYQNQDLEVDLTQSKHKEFTLNEIQSNNHKSTRYYLSSHGSNNKREYDISQNSIVSNSNKQVNQILNEQQIQDLIELSELMEAKLLKSNEHTQKLISRVKLLEKENEYLSNNLKSKDNDISTLKNEIEDFKMKDNEYLNLKNTQNDKFKAKIRLISEDIEEKEKTIDSLLKTIQQKDDYIKSIVSKQEELISKLSDINKNNQQINKNYEEKLKEKDNQIDELKMNLISNKTDNEYQLVIQHLKDDNKKLLDMLKNTSEYKEFSLKAENNKMTLLTNLTTLTNDKEKNKKDWIPREALEISTLFIKNNKFDDFTEELINQLILDLNIIWSQREKVLLSKLNIEHKKEIDEYKRKLVTISKSDELVNQKAIAALRKENRSLKDSINSITKEYEKVKNLPKGMDAIQKNLLNKVSNINIIRTKQEEIQKLTGNNKVLQAEILLLKEILNSKNDENETKSQSDFNSKSTHQIKQQVSFDNIKSNIFISLDNISQEFKQRFDLIMSDYEGNIDLIKKLLKWLIESIKEIINNKIN